MLSVRTAALAACSLVAVVGMMASVAPQVGGAEPAWPGRAAAAEQGWSSRAAGRPVAAERPVPNTGAPVQPHRPATPMPSKPALATAAPTPAPRTPAPSTPAPSTVTPATPAPSAATPAPEVADSSGPGDGSGAHGAESTAAPARGTWRPALCPWVERNLSSLLVRRAGRKPQKLQLAGARQARSWEAIEPKPELVPPAVANPAPCGMREGEDCCGGGVLSGGRRLYDVFVFNNDWELFEVRLGTLAAAVDTFIVLQSNITFAGTPKAIASLDSPRLQPWRRCVRLITVESLGRSCPATVRIDDGRDGTRYDSAGFWPDGSGWRDEVEFWVRDQWHYGLYGVGDDDHVMFSDLDEIPDPRVVTAVLQDGNSTAHHSWFVMQVHEYAYNFRNLRIGVNPQQTKQYFTGGMRSKQNRRWFRLFGDVNYTHDATSVVTGALATKMRPSGLYLRGRNRLQPCTTDRSNLRRYRAIKPAQWGNREPLTDVACFFGLQRLYPRTVAGFTIGNGTNGAGWHCNNCFPNAAMMLRKLCAFGWMLQIMYSRGFGPQDMLKIMRNGRIVHATSRRSLRYRKLPEPDGVAPPFVVQHRDRYPYLLDPAALMMGNFTGCPHVDKDRKKKRGGKDGDHSDSDGSAG